MGGRGSGGARSRSGPPPEPNALKRHRDGKEWTILPAAGRIGPAPEWPDNVPEPNGAELIHWRTLWALPQALVWEADHIHDQVALYCRVYLEAMAPNGPGNTRTLARQLQGELLLSPTSMLSGRYVVGGTDEAAAIEAAIGADASVSNLPSAGRPGSAKTRFTVVPVGPDPSAVAPREDDEDEDDDVGDDDPDEDSPPF